MYGRIEINKEFDDRAEVKRCSYGKGKFEEGFKFDITDAGANLIIFFPLPIEKEIDMIQNQKIQYAYTKEDNVIIMLFKFGLLPWGDAPYSVHLSKNLSGIHKISSGQGLALTIILVDAKTGIVKALRLVGLNNRFSKELRKDILLQKDMSFDGYDENLNRIFANHTTNSLIKRAKVMGKID